MAMDPEARLLAGVAQGDESAFAELFCRYQRRLTAFFLKRTRDLHAAEELVQETMMVVWQRASSFNHRSRPSSWILGIAYRKFLEWQRRESKQEPLHQPHEGEDDEFPSVEAEAGRVLSKEELIGQIKAALEELSEEHRLVVELTFEQGLSYGEIAQILKIRPGTVKSRMFYAKRKLKEVLRSRGMKGDELWRISKM